MKEYFPDGERVLGDGVVVAGGLRRRGRPRRRGRRAGRHLRRRGRRPLGLVLGLLGHGARVLLDCNAKK